MEYLLKKNILPPHILKDISDYNRLDLLDLEWYRYLHSLDYRAIMWQLEYTKAFYDREIIMVGSREVLIKNIINFPLYILAEIDAKNLFW
tara:strand:+ start:132 stop:401 length:270 start_codon:yes stop_codon:yes gene_type:complete